MPRQTRLDRKLQRIHVVAGILCNDSGEVLINDRQRARSMQDRWEFPGGKVADGESADAALARELREELGVTLLAFEPFERVEHDYPDLRVLVDFFVVTRWEDVPQGREGQQLLWVDKDRLGDQNMLAADAPVVELIQLRL